MAMDGRDRWVINEDRGVLDALDRPRTIGVGIDGGGVVLQLGGRGGWVKLPPGVATELGMDLRSADITLERQLNPPQRES